MKNNFNFDQFLSEALDIAKKETSLSDIQDYVKKEKERLNREVKEESIEFTTYVHQIGQFYRILTTGEGSVNLNKDLNKEQKKMITSIVNKIDEVEEIPAELRTILIGNSFLTIFKLIPRKN